MSDTGIVKIHNKEYKTVALRVNEFRVNHPEHTIETEVQSNADVVVIKAWIKDGDKILATGYAEEVRDSTNINKTSALENCETSAVGRALAFYGYGGSEIASANEVSSAVIAGAKKEVSDYMASYTACLKANLDLVLAIQQEIKTGDTEALKGVVVDWYDMSEADQKMLFSLPPSKGGFFTTSERDFIKTQFITINREVLESNK